jgi:hypothetical protein
MPQKHDNYTRKFLTELERGVGGKSDYKDCFRSQKLKIQIYQCSGP